MTNAEVVIASYGLLVGAAFGIAWLQHKVGL